MDLPPGTLAMGSADAYLEAAAPILDAAAVAAGEVGQDGRGEKRQNPQITDFGQLDVAHEGYGAMVALIIKDEAERNGRGVMDVPDTKRSLKQQGVCLSRLIEEFRGGHPSLKVGTEEYRKKILKFMKKGQLHLELFQEVVSSSC